MLNHREVFIGSEDNCNGTVSFTVWDVRLSKWFIRWFSDILRGQPVDYSEKCLQNLLHNQLSRTVFNPFSFSRPELLHNATRTSLFCTPEARTYDLRFIDPKVGCSYKIQISCFKLVNAISCASELIQIRFSEVSVNVFSQHCDYKVPDSDW